MFLDVTCISHPFRKGLELILEEGDGKILRTKEVVFSCPGRISEHMDSYRCDAYTDMFSSS